jgi:m7GpppX diphosphatase
MLEAGKTQATGKAFVPENIISQLETPSGGDDAGMADVSLMYFLGEASELWMGLFGELKAGESLGSGLRGYRMGIRNPPLRPSTETDR